MGGRIAGGAPALLMAALLVVVDATSPAEVAGKEEDGPSPSPSPATEAEVRVTVDWEHRDDLSFEYLLTNWPAPLEYPYDGDLVSSIGGCPGEEWGGPMPPLVLPESLTSSHLEDSPYSLVVTAQGVCSILDYAEQFVMVEQIGETVKVWATAEYWAPGGTAPYRTAKLGPIPVPIFVQESSHRPYRRKFDAEIRVPSTDEALAEAAARAARPVDDDKPAVEAPGPDAPDARARVTAFPDMTQADVTARIERRVGALVWLILLLDNYTKYGDWAIVATLLTPMPAFRDDQTTEASTPPTDAAEQVVRDLLRLAGLSIPKPPPSDPPPQSKLRPHRQWVYVTEKLDFDLLPGQWYQAEADTGGRWSIYTEDGDSYIGSMPNPSRHVRPAPPAPPGPSDRWAGSSAVRAGDS